MLYIDGAELHSLSIEGEKAVGQQLAYTCEVFQSLGCLNSSEHTGNGT